MSSKDLMWGFKGLMVSPIEKDPIRLYVPALRDRLMLDRDWTFTLHREHRNSKFWEAITGGRMYDVKDRTIEVTLPKGTLLSVDRIYIRNGCKNFDSITFRTAGCPNKKLNKKRFWVKLHDANRITCYAMVDEDKKEDE